MAVIKDEIMISFNTAESASGVVLDQGCSDTREICRKYELHYH